MQCFDLRSNGRSVTCPTARRQDRRGVPRVLEDYFYCQLQDARVEGAEGAQIVGAIGEGVGDRVVGVTAVLDAVEVGAVGEIEGFADQPDAEALAEERKIAGDADIDRFEVRSGDGVAADAGDAV